MKAFFLGVFLLMPTLLFAQIEITFPTNRAVFQRNKDNGASVPIAGTFTVPIQRVDVRLTPIQGGNSLDWTPISYNPAFGYFSGNLYVVGGWYKLEVRGIENDRIVAYSTLDKFGVGEVFLISGQSNAQGYFNSGNPSAQDDRVNCVSNFYSPSNSDVPFAEVSHLSANSRIAPLGNGSWCYGKLGDLLVQRLGVPVLFMNAGFEAMAIEEWKKSADGARGYNFYANNFAEPGFPYQNIRRSIHNYITMFGIRAILWHQGESDRDLNTSQQTYVNNLQEIISKSRNESAKNISWVVSRASRTQRGTSQTIINAQNQVINSTGNVFAGPSTDNITNRPDGVHFFGSSLIELAEAWSSSLDGNFFNNSNPYPPNSTLNYTLDCDTNGSGAPLKIRMPDGFKSYQWLDERGSEMSKSSQAQVGQGAFRGKAVDFVGNVYYTPKVRFTGSLVPPKPSITAEGATTFCQGGSVRLTSSESDRIYWTTAEQTKSITVTQSGIYHVRKFNFIGCSNVSDNISISVRPSPQVNVSIDGPTTFCSDKSLTLSSSNAINNQWSSGENSQKIVVNKSGEYSVRVRNEFGCETTSQKIKVTVNPQPPKPTIFADGGTLFCADKSVKLTSNIPIGITWNNGSKENFIEVKQTGDYFVTNTNEFGCSNQSNIIPIKVNPLPARPSISADGPTIICEGENLKLTSTENIGYEWSDGTKTRDLIAKKSGVFSVKVIDKNGCFSPPSAEINVTAKSNPQPVSIIQSGTYTLEVFTVPIKDQVFEWYLNDTKLSSENPIIKARQTGKYGVKGSVTYPLPNGKTLRCFSKLSEAYNYVIDPSNKGMSIFPNPVIDGNMSIETLDDHEDAKIMIYSSKGFFVKEFKVDKFDTRKTFDLKDLSGGNRYAVRVSAQNYEVVKWIWVE